MRKNFDHSATLKVKSLNIVGLSLANMTDENNGIIEYVIPAMAITAGLAALVEFASERVGFARVTAVWMLSTEDWISNSQLDFIQGYTAEDVADFWGKFTVNK